MRLNFTVGVIQRIRKDSYGHLHTFLSISKKCKLWPVRNRSTDKSTQFESRCSRTKFNWLMLCLIVSNSFFLRTLAFRPVCCLLVTRVRLWFPYCSKSLSSRDTSISQRKVSIHDRCPFFTGSLIWEKIGPHSERVSVHLINFLLEDQFYFTFGHFGDMLGGVLQWTWEEK